MTERVGNKIILNLPSYCSPPLGRAGIGTIQRCWLPRYHRACPSSFLNKLLQIW